jgi:hypothetical protein
MIPKSYVKAELRCTLPVSPDGFIGIGFNQGDEVIRIQIPISDALSMTGSLVDSIAQYLRHSEISSGNPSSEVSPAEQLKV